MTTLPNPSTLSSLGIDVLERVIGLSALCLHQANTDPLNSEIGSDSPYFSAVQFSFSQTGLFSGAWQIQAKIPYWRTGLVKSANIRENILPFSSYTNDLSNFPVCSPTQAFQTPSSGAAPALFPVPSIPNDIVTLEQLFVWAVNLWHKSIALVAHTIPTNSWTTSVTTTTGSSGTSTVSGLTNFKPSNYNDNASAQCTLNSNDSAYTNYLINLVLPFDWFVWTVEGNLIQSLIHVGVQPV